MVEFIVGGCGWLLAPDTFVLREEGGFRKTVDRSPAT